MTIIIHDDTMYLNTTVVVLEISLSLSLIKLFPFPYHMYTCGPISLLLICMLLLVLPILLSILGTVHGLNIKIVRIFEHLKIKVRM